MKSMNDREDVQQKILIITFWQNEGKSKYTLAISQQHSSYTHTHTHTHTHTQCEAGKSTGLGIRRCSFQFFPLIWP